MILDHFGLSRRGYRKVRKGVKKRLTRLMLDLSCRNVTELIDLARSPGAAGRDVRQRCRLALTVSISRFFRDRRLWEVLESTLLPEVLRRFPECVRVWSAGCASGEEAYSFLILWHRVDEGRPRPPSLEFLATDVNPVVLERAREGLYGRSSLKEVPADVLEAYFVPEGAQRFRVAADLRSSIRWMALDFLRDPPPAGVFHLIFLRNSLLTYHREPEISRVFAGFFQVLAPGGFLVLGNRERPPPGFSLMRRSDWDPHIYQKPGATASQWTETGGIT